MYCLCFILFYIYFFLLCSFFLCSNFKIPKTNPPFFIINQKSDLNLNNLKQFKYIFIENLLTIIEEAIKVDTLIRDITIFQVLYYIKIANDKNLLRDKDKARLRNCLDDLESTLRLYFRRDKDNFADVFCQEILGYKIMKQSFRKEQVRLAEKEKEKETGSGTNSGRTSQASENNKKPPTYDLEPTPDTTALASIRRRWKKIDFLQSDPNSIFNLSATNLNRQVIFIFFEIKLILEGLPNLTLPNLFNPTDSRNNSKKSVKRTLSRTSTISSQSTTTDTEMNDEKPDSPHINFDASSLDESNVNPPHVGEQINLDCFDLASCYQNNKRKFMLIQAGFILLIDPDPKVLGWAIIRKVLSLSRIQIKRTNETTLQVTVDNKNSAGNLKNVSEVFTFEDQIRCTAVYARIGRGRGMPDGDLGAKGF